MTSDFGSDIFDDGDAPPPSDPAVGTHDAADTDESAPAKPKKRRSRRAEPTKSTEEPAAEEPATDDAAAEATDAPAPAPRKRRTRRKKAIAGDEGDAETAEATEAPTEEAATGTDADSDASADDEAPAEKPTRKRRSRRKPKEDKEETDAEAETAASSDDDVEARAEPDTDRDEDDDRDEGRARRRRRGGRGRGRERDRERDRGRDREGNRREREERSRRAADSWTRRRTPFPTVAGQRLAILVDVDRLLAQAETVDGDISYTKLKTELSGKCNVIRTIAFGTEECAEQLRGPVHQAGYDVRVCRDSAARAAALAVDAMTLSPKIDCALIVPGSGDFSAVATALRAQGVRVVSAGFGKAPTDDEDGYDGHQSLGDECMFMP